MAGGRYDLHHKKVSDLIPYVNNSRTHSDEQVLQVASSIKEFGFTNPVLIDDDGMIIAGHGRVLAAKKLKMDEVPCLVLSGLTEAQKKAYVIADNKLALNSGWDDELLKLELEGLSDLGFDLDILGFSADELSELLKDDDVEGLTDEDEVPDLDNIDPLSIRGDVWQLGHNRVMCGDSTMVDDIEKLTQGEKAQLLHADPPYGMGKEGDGVANDNLYNEDLDKFQMDWWLAFRGSLVDNGSAYIWGNAPDLWRLWYRNMCDTELLELRNQIVWDKKSIPGMKSPLMTQFPETTEYCLFFQIGQQFIGSINAEDYPEEFDAVRLYLSAEADRLSLKPSSIKSICGVSMYSHWFTKSQFTLIPEKHYQKLAEELGGFSKPWIELKSEWDKIKGKGSDPIKQGRSFFDNAHEVMRDVWEFPRVTGEERHEHATPKPVAMMERVMKSSLPPKGLCLEPFGGSGSTLMGAEKSGRRCYSMELQPFYVDVIVNRWQNFTGKEAIHIESGKTYEELKNDRL